MRCIICKNNKINLLKNFGDIPRCHDFKKKIFLKKYKFALYKCTNCSVIQLKKSGNKNSFLPKLNWIKNNEPDEHLNDLIFFLDNKLKNNKKILLVSSFDRKIYDALKEKEYKNLHILELKKHLNISKKNPNQFLIQNKILEKKFIHNVSTLGKFDIIASCRVLEHTYDVKLFVNQLEKLLKPGGNLIFEIPDSKKSLRQGDIAMLWEEHPTYFTKKSVYKAFQSIGYNVENCKLYNYPQEDALVIRVKKKRKNQKSLIFRDNGEEKLGKFFIKKFLDNKKKLEIFLKKQIKRKQKIAIFGAGHRSVIYYHANKLSSYIDYILDDDKNKRNYFFPGTNLKIKPSSVLLKNKIGICLLSVSINKEKKIVNKLKKFNKDILFYSISPDSKYAL